MKQLPAIAAFTILLGLIGFEAHAQWAKISSGTTRDLYAITKSPAGTLFAAGDGVIIKSTDTGLTWRTVLTAGPLFRSVLFLSPSHAVAISDIKDSIYRSNDGGNSWISEYSKNCSRSAHGFRDACFTDSLTGYAPGYKTTDAGATWTMQFQTVTQFPHSPAAISFIDDSTGFIAGNNYWGSIYKTSDRGINWSKATVPYDTWEIYSMHFANSLVGYCTGQEHKGGKHQSQILKTTDGGNNWVSIYKDSLKPYYMSNFCINPTTCYAVGFSGSIIKTTNGGRSWFTQTSGVTTHLSKVLFVNDGTGFVVGRGGTVLRTKNGGGPASSTGTRELDNSLADTWIYPVPANGRLMIRSNGGLSRPIQAALFDLAGRVVYSQTLTSALDYMDLSRVQHGIYYLRLNRDGQSVQHKVVVG